MPGKTRKQLQQEFDEGVQRLRVFYNREGYSMLNPLPKEDDGYFLGRFVKNSLNKYQNGYLPEKNIKKLEEFPDWEWSPKNQRQKEKLNILVKTLKSYYKEHGHLWVPPDMEVDGENIMNAMEYYRGRYQSRNPSQKEIEAIESIPAWTWESPATSYGKEIKWEQKFHLLLKYALEFGHTKVPQLYKVGRHALGQWTDSQRVLNKSGKLLKHRKDRLEKIPLWVWEKESRDDLFNDGLRCLIEYYQEYGPKMPPRHLKMANGATLYEWILTQRQNYRLKQIAASRIRRLEAVSGWGWSGKEQCWMRNYKSLEQFNERFGHCEIPFTYKAKGIKLRSWLNKARRNYVKNQLLVYQRDALEKLNGWEVFMKKSQEYLSSLPVTPAEESIYRELDMDANQSLKSLSEKSGYAVTTCSAYRKRYFQRKG